LTIALAVGFGCKLPNVSEQSSDTPRTSGPTTSKPTQSPDEAIRALYRKVDEAYYAKDENALFDLASSDYTAKDEKGKVSTRDQAMRDMKNSFKLITEVTDARSDVMRVEEKDGLWEATVTFTLKAKVKNGGKTSTIETTNQSADQWSKSSNGEWKCIRSITKMSNTKIDGRQV
jgi:ketosteroid isomerase-like protein